MGETSVWIIEKDGRPMVAWVFEAERNARKYAGRLTLNRYTIGEYRRVEPALGDSGAGEKE